MELKDRLKIQEEIFNSCLDIAHKKGKDYSGNADSLSNFKRNAELTGMTKYQVWLIYFMKHIDSVVNSIKSNPVNPQTESEPLSERIKDIVVYATLLQCLLDEDKDLLKKVGKVNF